MIKPVSRTEAINQQLSENQEINPQNEQKYTEAIVAMTEAMEAVRREFQVKDIQSQISAANIVMTS